MKNNYFYVKEFNGLDGDLNIKDIKLKATKKNHIFFKFIDSSMCFMTDGEYLFSYDFEDEDIDLFDIVLNDNNLIKLFNEYEDERIAQERLNILRSAGFVFSKFS